MSIVQFCHNDHKHSAMTYSPFFLIYGYHLNKGLEPKQEYMVEEVGDFVEAMVETGVLSVKIDNAQSRVSEDYIFNTCKDR